MLPPRTREFESHVVPLLLQGAGLGSTAIWRVVQQQAAMLSYNDPFRLLALIFLPMRKAKKGKAGHIEGDYGKNGWDKLICCRYLILNLVIFLLRDDVPANQFGGAAVGPLFDYALCSLGAHSRQA